jgi:hypothetical protein
MIHFSKIWVHRRFLSNVRLEVGDEAAGEHTRRAFCHLNCLALIPLTDRQARFVVAALVSFSGRNRHCHLIVRFHVYPPALSRWLYARLAICGAGVDSSWFGQRSAVFLPSGDSSEFRLRSAPGLPPISLFVRPSCGAVSRPYLRLPFNHI